MSCRRISSANVSATAPHVSACCVSHSRNGVGSLFHLSMLTNRPPVSKYRISFAGAPLSSCMGLSAGMCAVMSSYNDVVPHFSTPMRKTLGISRSSSVHIGPSERRAVAVTKLPACWRPVPNSEIGSRVTPRAESTETPTTAMSAAVARADTATAATRAADVPSLGFVHRPSPSNAVPSSTSLIFLHPRAASNVERMLDFLLSVSADTGLVPKPIFALNWKYTRNRNTLWWRCRFSYSSFGYDSILVHVRCTRPNAKTLTSGSR